MNDDNYNKNNSSLPRKKKSKTLTNPNSINWLDRWQNKVNAISRTKVVEADIIVEYNLLKKPKRK